MNKVCRTKEFGGSAAQCFRSCSRVKSLTHVNPTRFVKTWNSRRHCSVQNRSSADAPNTTTMLVVWGWTCRMSSTIPGRFAFWVTSVAFVLSRSGGHHPRLWAKHQDGGVWEKAVPVSRGKLHAGCADWDHKVHRLFLEPAFQEGHKLSLPLRSCKPCQLQGYLVDIYRLPQLSRQSSPERGYGSGERRDIPSKRVQDQHPLGAGSRSAEGGQGQQKQPNAGPAPAFYGERYRHKLTQAGYQFALLLASRRNPRPEPGRRLRPPLGWLRVES